MALNGGEVKGGGEGRIGERMAEVLDVRGKRVAVLLGGPHHLPCHILISLALSGARVIAMGIAAELREVTNQIGKFAESANDPSCLKNIKEVELESGARQDFVDDVVNIAWGMFGGLDAFLSYTAHIGSPMAFLDSSEGKWDEIMNVNFLRTCMVCKAVGRMMRDSKTKGSIIFVTSILGTERSLYPHFAFPSALFAAVNHLARGLAMEFGKHGIRVNAIAQGLSKLDSVVKVMGEDLVKKEGERIVPLRRWLEAKRDLPGIILYFLSDSSSFVTGTVAIVDGGQSLTRPRLRSYM